MNIIRNKKGLQMKSMFFAVIVVSMVILAAGNIVGEWSTVYHSGLTYDLDEYEDLDSFANEAETQSSQITPKDSDPGTGDFEGKMFSGGYGILGKIFSPFSAVWNMLSSIEERFGFADQEYIRKGILALMFFAIITMIIAIIFRLSRTNA